jgi:hypothetical protein
MDTGSAPDIPDARTGPFRRPAAKNLGRGSSLSRPPQKIFQNSFNDLKYLRFLLSWHVRSCATKVIFFPDFSPQFEARVRLM